VRRALSLLLALALGAPAAAQQEAAPPLGGRLAELAAVRGRPAQPPRTLAQHYLFEGATTFHLAGREPITQGAEVNLGGPVQLRYLLRASGNKNVFLVSDDESAWMRTGDEDFRDYPARELAVQTWMRWTLCRFPWGAEEVLRDLPEQAQEVQLDGPFGPARLRLDDAGLPAALVHAEAALEVADWRTLRSGARLPATWHWRLGPVEQVERFTRIEDRVLLFDRAFAPPLAAPPELQWLAEAPGDGRRARLGADSLAVVHRPEASFLRGPADGAWHAALAESRVVAPSLFEWRDEEGRVLATAAPLTGPLPQALPAGVAEETRPAGLFLRWLSYGGAPDPDARAAALREGAARGGLEEAGPVWRLRPAEDGRRHRAELLLPVRERSGG
jgi:hypothetical protein